MAGVHVILIEAAKETMEMYSENNECASALFGGGTRVHKSVGKCIK